MNIIISMYSKVKSRVKFNNKSSNEFNRYLGVRQGECLSPLLFLCFSMIFVYLFEVLRPCQQLRLCRAGQLPVNTVPGQA